MKAEAFTRNSASVQPASQFWNCVFDLSESLQIHEPFYRTSAGGVTRPALSDAKKSMPVVKFSPGADEGQGVGATETFAIIRGTGDDDLMCDGDLRQITQAHGQ